MAKGSLWRCGESTLDVQVGLAYSHEASFQEGAGEGVTQASQRAAGQRGLGAGGRQQTPPWSLGRERGPANLDFRPHAAAFRRQASLVLSHTVCVGVWWRLAQRPRRVHPPDVGILSGGCSLTISESVTGGFFSFSSLHVLNGDMSCYKSLSDRDAWVVAQWLSVYLWLRV